MLSATLSRRCLINYVSILLSDSNEAEYNEESDFLFDQASFIFSIDQHLLLQFPERVAKLENLKALNGILSFLVKIPERGYFV